VVDIRSLLVELLCELISTLLLRFDVSVLLLLISNLLARMIFHRNLRCLCALGLQNLSSPFSRCLPIESAEWELFFFMHIQGSSVSRMVCMIARDVRMIIIFFLFDEV
jgi:hypothetical protein